MYDDTANNEYVIFMLTHQCVNQPRSRWAESNQRAFAPTRACITEVCLACSCKTESKGNRRVLHNPRASHFVPVLRSFMQDRFLQEDIDNVLPSSAESSKSYYVCMKYFRSLETYLRTKTANVNPCEETKIQWSRATLKKAKNRHTSSRCHQQDSRIR